MTRRRRLRPNLHVPERPRRELPEGETVCFDLNFRQAATFHELLKLSAREGTGREHGGDRQAEEADRVVAFIATMSQFWGIYFPLDSIKLALKHSREEYMAELGSADAELADRREDHDRRLQLERGVLESDEETKMVDELEDRIDALEDQGSAEYQKLRALPVEEARRRFERWRRQFDG